MPWSFFFFTFVNMWWLSLFAVLPWGVRRVENPDPMHSSGAPEKTHLGKKAAATSVIALLLTFAIKWVIESGIINVRS